MASTSQLQQTHLERRGLNSPFVIYEEKGEEIGITLPLGFITSTVIDPLWTAILSQAWKIRGQVILNECWETDKTPVDQAEGHGRRSI